MRKAPQGDRGAQTPLVAKLVVMGDASELEGVYGEPPVSALYMSTPAEPDAIPAVTTYCVP